MHTYISSQAPKELFVSIDEAAMELMHLMLPLSESQMNAVPFKDSWTAAQLATHVTKSNNGMVQALEMEGKPATRKPDERVKELKDTFLDFSTKLKSPDFIIPESGEYRKELVIGALKKSNDKLKKSAAKANPDEMISLPAAFGEITKLELFHFVLYHTKRHIHQLKNIVQHI
ncbi:MAG: DinB family protein [Chitinophagaceae bacterium]